MDIYELRDEIGNSGFDHVRIVDSSSYDKKRPNDGLLYEGDLEGTSALACDSLDNAEIVSIDIDFEKKAVTIDADFGNADDYESLSQAYESSEEEAPEGLAGLDGDELWDEYDWED